MAKIHCKLRANMKNVTNCSDPLLSIWSKKVQTSCPFHHKAKPPVPMLASPFGANEPEVKRALIGSTKPIATITVSSKSFEKLFPEISFAPPDVLKSMPAKYLYNFDAQLIQHVKDVLEQHNWQVTVQ